MENEKLDKEINIKYKDNGILVNEKKNKKKFLYFMI